METPPFLVDQLAAERSVSTMMARRALYLKGLADRGCSLKEASDALGIASSGVRELCRTFLIDLANYRPYAKKRDAGEAVSPKSRDIHKPAHELPVFGSQALGR
jgi:hypothetical protein